jgi:acyl-CoA synthetase (AMP-forming)/AMP-acid ligase II/acyl carrier protein
LTPGPPSHAAFDVDRATPYLDFVNEEDDMDLRPGTEHQDIVNLLRFRARTTPDHLAYHHESRSGDTRLTYAGLDAQARVVAARLQAFSEPGEPALLLYPSGLDFLAGFFGCLYAGVIAVPTHSPEPPLRPQGRSVQRIVGIARDAEPSVVLTTAALGVALRELSTQIPSLAAARWIDTDQETSVRADAWVEPAISAATLAFLQYTSGSTGAPKGVMVSHGNVLANERMIKATFGHDERTILGSWLPLFHDMGLIGNILQPLYLGVPCHFMAPIDFVKRPVRWLEQISRHRVTTTGAPDFAYRLCVDTISDEEKAKLDLSSWNVAYNGAEPVRWETLERFAAAFASCGFRASALSPTYGLAEATLQVAGVSGLDAPLALTVDRRALERGEVVTLGGSADRSLRSARVVVGCGAPCPEQEMAIVNPETRRPVPAGHVGEIWIAGPHVSSGYWRRPDATAERFDLALADDDRAIFFRTGDLGFVGHGQLFVTGRESDLIIVRGANHDPGDIEWTVDRVDPRLRVSCAVAVDVDQQERLVVVQEIDAVGAVGDVERLWSATRRLISEAHELDLHALILVRPGSIPRTSSGKIQRRVCRDQLLRGELAVLASWDRDTRSAPASSRRTEGLKPWLVGRVARLLRLQPHEVDPARALSEYGIDSAAAVMLAAELEDKLRRELPSTLAWDYPTINAIVTFIEGAANDGHGRQEVA